MAVLQAVRAQPIAIARRRQPTRRRARRATNRVGLSLAGILVAFLLGLFYLTQTIGAATAGYDVDRLNDQRLLLERQLSSQQGQIAQWGGEPAIVRAAQAAGLDSLGDPLRLAAR
ncbi:MAG: hypothetical protein ACXWQ6_07070 [Candidatus Limnocylindrales bacterium]